MKDIKYIALDGPIGVGKTSLTKLLTQHFNARGIFEKAEENPFLTKFYRDRENFAFTTQLFFLLSRFEQQRELNQYDLFQQMTISDYLFAKDRIFAYLNLDEDELTLYEKVYNLLNERILKPDLTIYLHADIDVLRKRIRKRNREYEKELSEEYLREVIGAYNDFFFYYNDSPLLVVDTSEIDFVSNTQDFHHLVNEIGMVREGVWHFIPLGSK